MKTHAIGLLTVILLATPGCASSLLLFPTTDPLSPGIAERLTVPWEGGVLEIWRQPSPGARAGGAEAFDLQFTGNASRAERVAGRVAARWGRQPVEVWAVNYPGYGGSSGAAALADVPRAALAAYDELHAAAGDRPILVGGNSLGGAVALMVAANRPVAGLVLQNPPPLRDLILGRHGWWNLWILASIVAWQIPAQLDALENASRATAPAVFLLASDDQTVPPEYQRRVIDAYAGPIDVVTLAAGHNARPTAGDAMAVDEAIKRLWQGVLESRRQE